MLLLYNILKDYSSSGIILFILLLKSRIKNPYIIYRYKYGVMMFLVLF